MKSNFAPRRHRLRGDEGAALVIILALLVLLTGIVAIFLSRALVEQKVSVSSANQTKADILCRSAADMITGGLKQEIANGSTTTVVGPTTNQTTLYFPISATNMVPQRIGNATNATGTDFAPNLVRRSVRNDSLLVPSLASAVNSSSSASYNGRTISLARWNSHYLIPRANYGNTNIDSTPTNYFTAPDWVMVTTSGPKVLTTPDPTTIGRYAYAVYDEGGLLDANVAGYPSSIVTSPTQSIDGTNMTLGGKGSEALADLTVIGLTQSDVNNLVGWRNYATVQPTGTLTGFTFPPPTGTNYYGYVTSNTNGFLTVNAATINGQTDQAFPTRQALLKFQRATGFSQDALQYLGTFSRDLEQPTFYPDPTRPMNTTHNVVSATSAYAGYGGNDAYSTDGSRQNLLNPSLLTVRDAAGLAVIKRRFPLNRIALLEQVNDLLRNGTSLSAIPASELNTIYQNFGLTWDATNLRWIYYHQDAATSHSATTPSAQILKLSDIAALGTPTREADFFETLMAVINCESIAKQNGTCDDAGTSITSPHRYIDNCAAVDGKVYYQIMQIGANIISQYTADSYPFRIGFDPSSLHDFFGVKNLPYLAGWKESWYRMKQLTATDVNSTEEPPADVNGHILYPYETWSMCQPIIWNPNAPNANLKTSLVPTNFRVTAGSTGGTASTAITVNPLVRPPWWTTGSGAQSTFPAATAAPAKLTPASWAQSTLTPNTSVLTFNATPNTTGNVAASFQEPYRLLYQYPSGSNATAGSEAQEKFSLNYYGSVVDTTMATSDAPTDGTTIIGFYTGKCWTGNYQYLVPTANYGAQETANCLDDGYISSDFQMVLEYQDPSGNWIPYDTIDQVYQLTFAGSSLVDDSDVAPDVRGYRTCFRFDPRTNRWGLTEMSTSPLAVNPSGVTTATPATIGCNNPWHESYNIPQATTLSPNAGFNTGCVDLVGFAGNTSPVGWNFNTSVAGAISDLSVNLNTGTNTSYIPGAKAFYFDTDGILRRASGAYMYTTKTNPNNDGLPYYTSNYNSRPTVLNRPFQSVAELGYVFSDTPWKNLDFFTPESGFAALLDGFCLNELQNAPNDVSVEGRVNLNTRQPLVLQALIQGSSKAEGGVMSNTEAAAAATALTTWTQNTTAATSGILQEGPLRNRSELVGKFVKATVTVKAPPSSSNTPIPPFYDGNTTYYGYSSTLTSPNVFASATDATIQRRRECVMRALSDSGNARTWNLLIDVIAQTGNYPSTAKTSADLAKFVVTGERRYWVHVAIDRYTDTIVAESFEPVDQ